MAWPCFGNREEGRTEVMRKTYFPSSSNGITQCLLADIEIFEASRFSMMEQIKGDVE